MEHAEIISEAYAYTKQAFFSLSTLPRWIVLFFYIVGPIIAGYIAATVVFQLLALPVLTTLLVNDSFGFTPENLSYILQFFAGLIGVGCVFLIPLMQGYCVRVFRSSDALPPTGNLWGLFFNGWRVNLTIIIYMIPLFVVSFVYMLVFFYFFPDTGMYAPAELVNQEGLLYVGTVFSYAALQFVTIICVALFAFVGITHLARTGSIRDAVSFRTISGIIRKIGWYDYILSLVIMSILYLMVTFVLLFLTQLFSHNIFASAIFTILYIFVLVPITVFFVRYLSNVYDTAFVVAEPDDTDFDDF